MQACAQELTTLKSLTLHPMDFVSTSGLRVLGDYCDSLEHLFLGKCPAANFQTLLQIIECCIRLEVTD